ncbi:LysR family transcriptional regulator [Roseibium aggregatum]|uniref:LysR family transcriptional regulator n=1 Tax=Roseibium aggregatum TaxID=187304 RepID=A0A939IZY0_9HYPH|nr:LysR family transcriptional regulator [Roseibium aggregatum]MBN9670526.1 LysR family transcriptional regulator [Roseibium aggregatum]
MDIRQIRVFKSVFDAGSIVGAAELERCAPSVIAHHLVNLEHRLGQTLFERSSRGVLPTAAGQQFYLHAAAILRAVDNAESDMRDTTDSLTGRAVVGLAFSAVMGTALPLIQTVAERQPGLQLEIAESVSGATIERLLAADVDLAVAYNPPRDSRLALTPLLEEDMLCLGTRQLIGDPDKPMTFEHFLTLRFVLTRKGPRGRPITDDTDIQKQLERNASFFSENVAAAALFVNSGYGVILGTPANLAHGAFNSNIIGREIVDPSIKRSLYLCERRDAPTSRSMAYVRDLFIEILSEEIASGRWECRSLL